ncbi:MAG: hypothetical protein MJZ16_14465, partial [Bacteroidales bacterium]|nr:hypothetical protein [Bacteroidales bacterium]
FKQEILAAFPEATLHIAPGITDTYATLYAIGSDVAKQYKYGWKDYKNPFGFVLGLKSLNVFSFYIGIISNLYLKKGAKPFEHPKDTILDLLDWIYFNGKCPSLEVIKDYFNFLSNRAKLIVIRKLFYLYKMGHISRDLDIFDYIRSIHENRKIVAEHRTAYLYPITIDITIDLLLEAIDVYKLTGQFLTLNGVLDVSVKNIGPGSTYYPISIQTSMFTKLCPGRTVVKELFIKYQLESGIAYQPCDRLGNKDIDQLIKKKGLSYALSDLISNNNKPIMVSRSDLTGINSILMPEGKEECELSELYTTEIDDKLRKSHFCQGNISGKQDSRTGRNFLWCKKFPCLESPFERYNPFINEDSVYKDYTLADFMKIARYDNILTQTGTVGVVPSKEYMRFVDVIVKAKRISEHLRCRECGHIMMPQIQGHESSGYSRYACENSVCSKNGKLVYINHCFNCNVAVIDGRDSKTCPNGWYICPECNACCSDELAGKYRILLHYPGHKEKHELYCYKCGSKKEDGVCPICNSKED